MSIKTTNKDLSCKVMEAGITLDTMFSWTWIDGEHESPILTEDYEPMFLIAPAPTACEWLEVMPQHWFKHLPRRYGVDCITNVLCLHAVIEMIGDADKIADMALWLVEQGLWGKH